MKISYGITVCNEFIEIQRLIAFLLQHKRPQDNIVVLYDEANGDPAVKQYLLKLDDNISFNESRFDGHFADWKNRLSSLCNGDYIFQLDADEMPHENLIATLPDILDHNSAVELYAVPRVNTVSGLTQEHVTKWRWNVNESGWVNWPDYQTRIYKNKTDIYWHNRVHERIIGHTQFGYIPMEEEFAIYHPKTIERQERQNEYYNTL